MVVETVESIEDQNFTSAGAYCGEGYQQKRQPVGIFLRLQGGLTFYSVALWVKVKVKQSCRCDRDVFS